MIVYGPRVSIARCRRLQVAHHQGRGPQQAVAVVADEAIEVVRTHHLVKAPGTSEG
jgi:hypothetical protein